MTSKSISVLLVVLCIGFTLGIYWTRPGQGARGPRVVPVAPPASIETTGPELARSMVGAGTPQSGKGEQEIEFNTSPTARQETEQASPAEIKRTLQTIRKWTGIKFEIGDRAIEKSTLAAVDAVVADYGSQIEYLASRWMGELSDMHCARIEKGECEVYGPEQAVPPALPGEIVQRGYGQGGTILVTRIALSENAKVARAHQEWLSLRLGLADIVRSQLGVVGGTGDDRD